MLKRMGSGYSVDQALHEATGLDTDALDAAIQKVILDEFPTIGLTDRTPRVQEPEGLAPASFSQPARDRS